MWYFKNKTQLQQLVFCEYCLFFLFLFFYYLLCFLFLGTNIRMEQKYPKLLYCIEIQPLQFYHHFDALFPTFLLFSHFKWKKCHYIVNTSGFFFSFGKNYKTFKNLKQIKYKKSVCGLCTLIRAFCSASERGGQDLHWTIVDTDHPKTEITTNLQWISLKLFAE